jgi:hypothetical protein
LATGLSVKLREVLEPEVESLNERVKKYDARIEQMAKENYPLTSLLKWS